MTADQAWPVPTGVTGFAFRAGMSRLAGGVTVVASGAGGDRATWTGMTATAVCSLSPEPPSLVVGVHRGGGTYRQVRSCGAFSVNVLAARHVELAATFAGRRGTAGPRPFAGWHPGALGVPVLADALAGFECRLAQCVPFGTHALLIGEIEAASCGNDDDEPLLYHRRRFHDLGRETEGTS